VLRILVRNLEHGGAGLHENLSTRQVRRFGGEVGVADVALGVGQVDQGVVERVLVRIERRALERTQPTAERSDLVNRFVDDPGRTGRVTCQGSRATRSQLVKLTANATELRGIDAGDANASLLVRDNVWTELEQGTTAGDVEVHRACEAG